MTPEESKCVKCGVTGSKYVMFYCDRMSDGPWCADCFVDATGCTDAAHGEGCVISVFAIEEDEDERRSREQGTVGSASTVRST